MSAFSKPEVQMKCEKCSFTWVAEEQFPVSLKKLYEANRVCPKCKKENITILFKPIDTFSF